MPNKKIYLAFLFTFILPAIGSFATEPKLCECGEHATGITGYAVQGPDCCSSVVAGTQAVVRYYVQNSGHTWEFDHSEIISSSVAQANCCENT